MLFLEGVRYLSLSPQDTNGRRFYLNHTMRVTSFQRPGGRAPTVEATPTSPPPAPRRAFMERHTSVDVSVCVDVSMLLISRVCVCVCVCVCVR